VSVPTGWRARRGQRWRRNGPGDPHPRRQRGALIREGRQVAGDGGQNAWITDAGAIAFFDQPLDPGETTEAGPLWPFGNFAAVKDMGSCSPPFTAEIARTLGERYEPA